MGHNNITFSCQLILEVEIINVIQNVEELHTCPQVTNILEWSLDRFKKTWESVKM
jgi:hypothetical protein